MFSSQNYNFNVNTTRKKGITCKKRAKLHKKAPLFHNKDAQNINTTINT